MSDTEPQFISRMERALKLCRLLFEARQGLKASELAQKLGCHRSTVYRDIESLSRANFPIWENEGLFGIDKDRYVTSVHVTLHEALALYLSARLLSAHSDKHNPHGASALEKLASALPDSLGQHILKTAAATAQRRPNPDYLHTMEILTRAWAERRQVRLTYHNPQTNESTERTFDPYFIEPSPIAYACYVIGHDHLRQAIRQLKIERIRQIELLDTSYNIRENFDPHEYLARAWGIMGGDERTTVKLRFSAKVAYRVRESDWPGAEDIQNLPDGGCMLTLIVSHTLEMKPWIRGWGPDCEVLEPGNLRKEIAQEMIAAGKMYEASSQHKTIIFNSL